MTLFLASALAVSLSPAPQDWIRAPRFSGFPFGQGAFAAADLDADGNLELLVSSLSSGLSNSVSIWNSNGDRDYAFGQTLPAQLSFPSQPTWMVVGDLDGNGAVDLIRPRLTLDELLVHLNPGSGVFGPGVVYPSPSEGLPFGADFDGDGDLDLGFLGEPAAWMTWNGAGFDLGPSLALPEGVVGARPEVADVDGDGLLDVVVENAPDYDALLVLLTRPGNDPEIWTVDLPAEEFGNINMVHSVGDLDGDGRTDLLAVRRAAGTPTQEIKLVPFLQTAFGQFVEQPIQSFGQSSPIAFLDASNPQLVDWDEDGDLDFVASNQGFVVFENDGSGQFASPRFVRFELGGAAAGARDADGDGSLDLIGTTAILYGDGSFGWFEAGLTENPPLPVFFDMTIEDLDGDGDADLVDAVGARVSYGDGTGEFGPLESLLPTPPAGFTYDDLFGRGDFNGDGRTDYLIERSGALSQAAGFALLASGAPGLLLDAGAIGASIDQIPSGQSEPGLGFDFDADGDLDLVTAAGSYENDASIAGEVNLVPGPALGFGDLLFTIDADLDGASELVTRFGSDLRVWKGAAGGPQLLTLLSDLGPGDAIRPLELDGDGNPDLAVLDGKGNRLRLFSSTPAGPSAVFELALATAGGFSNGGAAGFLTTGDLDLDGTDEILMMRDPSANFLVGPHFEAYRRVTGIEYEPWISFTAPLTAVIGDVDADGDPDLLGGFGQFVSRRLEGQAIDDLEAGGRRQYGEGLAAGNGVVPLIGVAGTLTEGSSPELRILRGSPGSIAIWGFGFTEAALPLGPVTAWFTDPVIVQSTVLQGAGGPGSASFVLPYQVGPGYPGVTFYKQAVLVDPANASISSTGGLEVRYGE